MDDAPEPTMETVSQQEALWVAAARSGRQEAFDRLVQNYQRRAVAVAYRLLGNVHDAADVAQDAFLRAYRNLDKLDDPRRFGPWLMRIVTNLSLNFRRSRHRTAAFPLEEVGRDDGTGRTAPAGEPADDASVEQEAVARELQTAMSKAIAELPEKQRLALVMFSIEGMPQKEVAEIMKCSVELVKWNVFQARKALRKSLATWLE